MDFVINFILSGIIALFFSGLTEWLTHKYILHGLGKKKNSWFHYHWNHHNISRKNNFYDDDYIDWIKSKSVRKEIYGLLLVLLSNITWLFVWPMLFIWFCFFTIFYFYVHVKAHVKPEWCKKYFGWHWDHHQGTNQDANWCVTFPLWDYILRTRVKYEYDATGKVIKKQ